MQCFRFCQFTIPQISLIIMSIDRGITYVRKKPISSAASGRIRASGAACIDYILFQHHACAPHHAAGGSAPQPGYRSLSDRLSGKSAYQYGIRSQRLPEQPSADPAERPSGGACRGRRCAAQRLRTVGRYHDLLQPEQSGKGSSVLLSEAQPDRRKKRLSDAVSIL